MPSTDPTLERDIQQRLADIHHRLSAITDTEAAAAVKGGFGAHGELDPLRTRLTDATDALLNRLSAIGGCLPFRPKA